MGPAEGLLKQAGSDPARIQGLYDHWSDNYDADIKEWGYEAPEVAVEFLRKLVPTAAHVLDAGCGTGLVGSTLRLAGFERVDGIDFSAASLSVAETTGAYRTLKQIDLTALPTSLASAQYEALICVGVMSYLSDIAGTCREFCRLVKRGSPIVLTQRSDLFETRCTQAAFDALVADGWWIQLEVTGQRRYLPENPEFSGIGVRYCIFRRC